MFWIAMLTSSADHVPLPTPLCTSAPFGAAHAWALPSAYTWVRLGSGPRPALNSLCFGGWRMKTCCPGGLVCFCLHPSVAWSLFFLSLCPVPFVGLFWFCFLSSFSVLSH